MFRALRRDQGSTAVLSVYVRKWFPERVVDAESMAEAAFLEWDFWEKMKVTIHGKD